MIERTQGRAFVVMPFGRKKAPDGTEIDFDHVYEQLLSPAVAGAGLSPSRADADRRGSSIHADMFQELLLAEFVLADLTLDNPNVWYEIGIRHALRASGTVLCSALRDRLPVDLVGQRMQRYTLVGGRLDGGKLEEERNALTDAIRATLDARRNRKASPIFAQLPNLREPDWRSLRVGDVNEFWQALEALQRRVVLAQHKQRPGDILVLAEEMPNRELEFEALRTAAEALLRLRSPHYALAVLKQARVLDPDDVKCRQLEGLALNRLMRFEEARAPLHRLAEECRDNETLSLLASTWKDEWTRLWKVHPSCDADPVLAARDTAATLARATEAYVEAFRADPADFYSGNHALTLGRLWEHITGLRSKVDLALIAAGVRWAVDCALTRDRTNYWARITCAELAMIEGERCAPLCYDLVADLAVQTRDRLVFDRLSQTLDLPRTLGFRPEIVAEVTRCIDKYKQKLSAQPERPAEPARVVLFRNHMIDMPGRKMPHFSEDRAEAAAAHIARELDTLGVGPGDLGISQAAAVGDLLFASACLARGMRLEIYLPVPEPEYCATSICYAAPHWVRDYEALKNRQDVTIRMMQDELGRTPEGINVYDRCNRWMRYSALAYGPDRVSSVTLRSVDILRAHRRHHHRRPPARDGR